MKIFNSYSLLEIANLNFNFTSLSTTFKSAHSPVPTLKSALLIMKSPAKYEKHVS